MKEISFIIATVSIIMLFSCKKNDEQQKLEIRVAELQEKINKIEKGNDSLNLQKEEETSNKISTTDSDSKEMAKSNNLFEINTKVNEISESCYHDPCSVGKSISTKIVRESNDEITLNVKLLGGSKDWDSKKIIWNDEPHELTVTCSKRKPRISFGDQTDILTLNNEMGVPGVLISSAELYFNYCHSSKLPIDEATIKFNYNVSE